MSQQITLEELKTISEAMNSLISQRSTADQEEGNDNVLIDQASETITRLLKNETAA